MSDDYERDSAETRTDDLLQGFDAFRTRGAGRPQPPELEPFPDEVAPPPQEYGTALTAMPTVITPVAEPAAPSAAPALAAETPTLPLSATSFSAAAEYTAVPPPPPFGSGAAVIPSSRPPRRSRARTGFILAAAAAIVIGLCAGAYSVVVKTDRSSSAPPATSASTSPSPQANDTENSKTITTLVVVDSVTGNGFTATSQGTDIKVTVQYTADTKFGTATRPLTRAQVTPGAHVWVRGRRSAFDTITASVVAGVMESEAATRSTAYAGV